METKIDFKIQTDYEVIGQGEMPSTPRQIGEWWVMPAKDYQGKIPPDIQKKMFAFLSTGEEIQGLLIAEDMRVIEAKREQEQQKKEAEKKAAETRWGVVNSIISSIGLGIAFFFNALASFDPMLIAVLEDGRWICLGTWYE
jgi:hypothetical protein